MSAVESISNHSRQLVQKLWSYCDILRDNGISCGDYAEQLTFLPFPKMASGVLKSFAIRSKNMSDLIPSSPTPGGRIPCYTRPRTAAPGRKSASSRRRRSWLMQKHRFQSLFQKDVRTINEHIQNLFEEKELSRRFSYPEIPG